MIQRTDKDNKKSKNFIIPSSLLSFSTAEAKKSMDVVISLAKCMRLVTLPEMEKKSNKLKYRPYLHIINKEGLEFMIDVKELPT